ncbi:hypothetical protein MSSIT_2026 [Methanosarcina siciliae T4/M]|uniref:Uncharacterized protein n=1 Tax=Methanosarcina siciliae T4/M TaxID=1434120 RepID=A0A0E3P511_9EURY|nr:hypothetical protein MSSIT_2026 [Methanosarcina siciliae T4/M]
MEVPEEYDPEFQGHSPQVNVVMLLLGSRAAKNCLHISDGTQISFYLSVLSLSRKCRIAFPHAARKAIVLP